LDIKIHACILDISILVHFSGKIWHPMATILMISLESTDQISCTLNSKGQSGPKFAQPIVLLM